LDGGDEEEIGGCGRVCQVEKEVGWRNGLWVGLEWLHYAWRWNGWCLEIDDEWHTGQKFSQLHLQIVILWLGENDRSATLSLILTWRARRYAKWLSRCSQWWRIILLAPFTCLVDVVEFPRDLKAGAHYSLLSNIQSKCCLPNCGLTQVANTSPKFVIPGIK
jgi:hypothetical protein